MDSDMKWFILLIVGIILIPVVGMITDSLTKNHCQIELAKAGKLTAEIKELCK